MNTVDLIDIWREVNMEKVEFTWQTLKPQPIFIRLDFFLINQELSPFIRQCEIVPGIRTDHSAVRMLIDFTIAVKGPGYWKLNTSLLHDLNYIDAINKLLEI